MLSSHDLTVLLIINFCYFSYTTVFNTLYIEHECLISYLFH